VGQRELKLETDLLAGQSVIESQLIRSSRKLEALCNLSQSLVRISVLQFPVVDDSVG